MHANTFKQTQPAGDGPLAQSAFSGEARLRELEHLAETARKVRDQAAAELTRNGSTHHIARDRIAAAERMLRKTQQEIAELRAQLGPTPRPAAPAAQVAPQDFELAVLLGHSKARFNRGDTAQSGLQLQQDSGPRVTKTPTPRAKTKSAPKRMHAHAPQATTGSWGRTLVFSALIAFSVGLGAIGTYAIAKTGSLTEASQFVREQGQQLFVRLRALLPSAGLDHPASDLADRTNPVSSPQVQAAAAGPRETQEAQARAAAEQRLTRQMAGRVSRL